MLRGLAHCRCCHAKRHGTGVGRNHVAHYYCSTRRKTHDCDQPVVPADEAERQLAQLIASFKPDPALRAEILQRLATDSGPESSETTKRCTALEERLRRMRDLYELGDLQHGEYVAHCYAINAELNAPAPEPIPDLDLARSVLEDFTTFWTTETEHEAKRQFLTLIVEGLAGRTPRSRRPAQALIPVVLRESRGARPRNDGA